MTTYTETNYLSDFLQSEQNEERLSREEVTVLAGSGSSRILEVGTVIGSATFGTPVVSSITGTGNGTITMGALGAKAQSGVYRLTCIAASANAGTFEVEDPTGNQMQQEVTVGGGATNVDDNFTITIADGATDFTVGATFTVTIPEGNGKVVALNTSAVDGTQNAYGIIGEAVTALDGVDKKSWAIVRLAVVKNDGLVWPVGISATAKATAIAQLKAKNIIIREDY